MARPLRSSLPSGARVHERDPVEEAIREFGKRVRLKLGRGGQPEDQLRGPVERLLADVGVHVGLEAIAYGEVALRDLRARPDYAVDVGNTRVGYIELKAPGHGVPPEWRPSKRDRDQWAKLSSLPNVLYSDGLTWGRYHFGELVGSIVHLNGSLTDPKRPLSLPDHSFELLIREFMLWQPERPRSLSELIKIVAGLCRLLRDEVSAILSTDSDHAGYEDLNLLAEDWKDLLFPDLDPKNFSDAYAQTVTFAMLLARINGIAFDKVPLHEIARQLGKKHSLMGRAFAVLTDSDATEELRVIETLRRVIGAVEWEGLSDGQTNIYAELYEKFLTEYDPDLRKKSGTYYTPEPAAHFMVDFINEILQDRLHHSWGFASDDVVVVDPAMGTGTFLVEVIRSVAETVESKQGKGAQPPRLRELFQKRLVGFERQVAPYAVAELRLHQALKTRFQTEIPKQEVRFLTDALENPRAQQERFRAAYKVIERSRAEANRIKREVGVMVVLGNPPHLENARGQAPWIDEPRDPALQSAGSVRNRPSIDDFRAPGRGRYDSDLHGLQWYFWRWALWKVFDAHPEYPVGVVALITPSSYTTGKAFAGMREYLRRTCDEGWIIDVSPEGNRSSMETRFFGDVQRRLCIGIFTRYQASNTKTPATIHYMSIGGTRDQKFDRLSTVTLSDGEWKECQDGWQDPFLPSPGAEWDSYPRLCDLLPWHSRGVTSGRNWVYGPNLETLKLRWQTFARAKEPQRRAWLQGESQPDAVGDPLHGIAPNEKSLMEEDPDLTAPVRVGFRSFDRQWLIPDSRLLARPRPPLWAVRSPRQIYFTEQSSHAIDVGPGIGITSLIPDLHYYNARSGSVYPLWRDSLGQIGNLSPGLLTHLSRTLRIKVKELDVAAYIAATVAHPGYTSEFTGELKQPGLRIPLTSDASLWKRAVDIGSRIIWLHTYGEQMVDVAQGRPQGISNLVDKIGPRVVAPIGDTPGTMPQDFEYDMSNQALRIGRGVISTVRPEVWDYRVTGMRILYKWLDYRLEKPRHKRISSDLDSINCQRWTAGLTDELLELVTVLTACVDLESSQADLLYEIRRGPTIPVADLEVAGVLPVPESATKPPKPPTQSELFPGLDG